MAFDKDAFLSAMDSMSVMELNDLVKAIEEKFGVSAAAMAAPAAGGGGGAAAAVVEEKTEFTVQLLEAGANKVQVIKAVREITALADRAKAMGYHLKSEELQVVFDEFKRLADKKKEVYDADIAALIWDKIETMRQQK